MNSDPDLIKLMEDVVYDLLGTPNGEPNNRNRADLRFGTNGSMSVNLIKGTWYSHEDDEGGGVIDLIKREKEFSEAREALEWAEREGYWVNGHANNGKPRLGPIVATYDYTDENGALLFQVTRYDKPKKDFRQRRPDGNGGWTWKVKGVRGVPYCLPRVIEAIGKQQIIYICEGEKDCNNLISRGLTATTNPGGANKWRDGLTPHFRGADLVIIADNDETGKTHSAEVAAKLTGTAKRIRLLDLGAVWPECKPKGDISDWLDGGHSTEELGAIVAGLPDWKQNVSARLGVLDAGDDITLPPPRAWLYGNLFARKFLSSLFGDGGVGKTALRYAQYLSMATGESLAGDHLFQRCRVLIVSFEDDMDELRRRIWALRIHYKISEDKLKGWLFYWTPGVKGGKLLELDKYGNPKAGELSTSLESIIVEKKLDFIGLDPFIKTHGVGENDNNAIDLVAQVVGDLMFKHNIGADVPHHVSKPGARGEAEPGDANRGRGASSLKDAARLVYTLNVMSKDEAKTFHINDYERLAYIRMDKGKVNIAPPSRKAIWFHLVGVQLGNANEMYPHGDEVQAVEPWFPPDMWQDVGDEQMDAIIAEIDAGMAGGVRFTNGARATTRAAWKIVVKHVPSKNEQQAREIIKVWIENGVLLSQQYRNETTRKDEEGLFENKDRVKGSDAPF